MMKDVCRTSNWSGLFTPQMTCVQIQCVWLCIHSLILSGNTLWRILHCWLCCHLVTWTSAVLLSLYHWILCCCSEPVETTVASIVDEWEGHQYTVTILCISQVWTWKQTSSMLNSAPVLLEWWDHQFHKKSHKKETGCFVMFTLLNQDTQNWKITRDMNIGLKLPVIWSLLLILYLSTNILWFYCY